MYNKNYKFALFYVWKFCSVPNFLVGVNKIDIHIFTKIWAFEYFNTTPSFLPKFSADVNKIDVKTFLLIEDPLIQVICSNNKYHKKLHNAKEE